MMRVVMVGDYPLEPRLLRGGVEAVMYQLAQGLARTQQVELHLVTRRKGMRRYRQETDHGPYVAHYLPSPRRLPNAFAGPWFDRPQMLRLFQRLQPDLIHAHGQEWYADAALHSGLPVVVTAHGIRHRETALVGNSLRGLVRRIVYDRMEASVLRRTRHLIAISPYVVNEVRRWYAGAAYPIDNPVADDYFALGGADDGKTVLFVGNVSPRKGVPMLLRAFAEVARRHPTARLLVVGRHRNAEEQAGFARRAADLGIGDRTTFTGQVMDTPLLGFYRECALLVLPSLEETAPVVVAQAMAAGKPVVATRVGGVPHMVADGNTGFLVDSGAAADLAARIVQLLDDAGLRARMGQRARQEAETRFRLAQVAARTVEVYQTVLDARQA